MAMSANDADVTHASGHVLTCWYKGALPILNVGSFVGSLLTWLRLNQEPNGIHSWCRKNQHSRCLQWFQLANHESQWLPAQTFLWEVAPKAWNPSPKSEPEGLSEAHALPPAGLWTAALSIGSGKTSTLPKSVLFLFGCSHLAVA